MQDLLTADEKMLINAVKYLPSISIILPFEPKLHRQTDLEYRLKLAIGKVESELLANYPTDKAMPVLTRLSQLTHKLDFRSTKKSIAIYVSPLMQKLLYLDTALDEKITIDESFEIRDLLYNKKQAEHYLVMLLSAKKMTMYLCNCPELHYIYSFEADNTPLVEKDHAGPVANFSDPGSRKEKLLEKFLHQMDEQLSELLQQHPLPVFVLGTERVLGHFNKISRNQRSLVDHIHGNYDETGEPELRKVLAPHVKKWKKEKEQNILHLLDIAMNANKLSAGMLEVWKAATEKNCRLLVVEKDYVCPARHGAEPGIIYEEAAPYDTPFFIKDAVDDVMELVLSHGGEVEFVGNGMLRQFNSIALVHYH